MSNELEKQVKNLEDLRDDIDMLLDKLENCIDDYRDVLNKIQEAKEVNTEKMFAPFIKFGFIPGAYFILTGNGRLNVYKIVAIRENQYGAVDVNDPEKVINMPLERNGESYLERYTLIDEKDAMERASKYTVNENGITVNKGVKDGE